MITTDLLSGRMIRYVRDDDMNWVLQAWFEIAPEYDIVGWRTVRKAFPHEVERMTLLGGYLI